MNGLDERIDKYDVGDDNGDDVPKYVLNYPFDIPCPHIGDHGHQTMEEPMRYPGSAGPGTVEVDFADKGLAQYGMIPEFLWVVGKKDKNGPNIHNLFSSAHAFVRMWELVEKAQGDVQ
jgi:hypothetical protein